MVNNAEQMATLYKRLLCYVVEQNAEWIAKHCPQPLEACDELYEFLVDLILGEFLGETECLERGYVFPWAASVAASMALYLCGSLLMGAIPLTYGVLRNILELFLAGLCLDTCPDYKGLDAQTKQQKATELRVGDVIKGLKRSLGQSRGSQSWLNRVGRLYDELSSYMHAMARGSGGLLNIIDQELKEGNVPAYLSLFTLSLYGEENCQELNRLEAEARKALDLLECIVQTWHESAGCPATS